MPLYPPKPPITQVPRADFEGEQFRKIIFEKGADVVWEQCAVCPCSERVNQFTGAQTAEDLLSDNWRTEQQNAVCSVCNGVGFELHSPTPTKVLIMDMRNNPKRFRSDGNYEEGTARVTFLPENKPNMGDRLTLANSVYVVSEMRRRSSSAIEPVRFPIATKILQLATGPTAVRVMRVRKAQANQTVGALLVEGTDFDVTVDGKVNWAKGIVLGTAPATGTTYAISYFANPRYRITSMPHGVRDTFVGGSVPTTPLDMPIACYAQLEYLGVQTNSPRPELS